MDHTWRVKKGQVRKTYHLYVNGVNSVITFINRSSYQREYGYTSKKE